MSILVKHFVHNPKVLIYLEELELAPTEKEKLTEMLSLIYHQKLLNHLLAELDEENKRLFLEKHINDDQEEAIKFLEARISNISSVVEVAIEEIELKLLEDFENLKEEN